MSIISSISIFYLSFTPLWISIVFLDVKSLIESTEHPWTEIISLCAIVVSFILSLLFLKMTIDVNDSRGAQTYTITQAEEEKTLTAEYLISYILPLFAFDFALWHQVLIFLVFFGTLAFLCIRHSYFSVNIVLELLHYRFYSCELLTDNGVSIKKKVITKEELLLKDYKEIVARPINNNFLVQISIHNEK